MFRFQNKLLKLVIIMLINICLICHSIANGFVDDQDTIHKQFVNVVPVTNTIFDSNVEIIEHDNYYSTRSRYLTNGLKYVLIGMMLFALLDIADAQSICPASTNAPAPVSAPAPSQNLSAVDATFYIQLFTLISAAGAFICAGAQMCYRHAVNDWDSDYGTRKGQCLRNFLCWACCLCYSEEYLSSQTATYPRQTNARLNSREPGIQQNIVIGNPDDHVVDINDEHHDQ